MKIRYPIAGIIILLIATTIWEHIMGPELYKAVGEPITFILFLSLLGLIVYLIAKIILNELFGILDDTQRHFKHKERRKEQQACMMHNINQELDEIEASLDAVSSNDKVTPIWGGQPSKKP